MKKAKLAIFASGNGTNASKIVDYFAGNDMVQIGLICVNKNDAPVLELARNRGLAYMVFNKEGLYDTNEVLNRLEQERITHIVLAGFLWLVPSSIIQKYPRHIINIHPALLPKYGGKGMYGMNVHRAVKAANENETGITIHQVNENYDEGKYLLQQKVVLNGTETEQEIAQKVQELEHYYYPIEIDKWVTENN